MKKMLKYVVLFSLLLICSACTSVQEEAVPVVIKQVEDRAPFELVVQDEVFDGEVLYLRAKVKVLTLWDADCAFIKLTTFKDGDEATEKLVSLKEILDKEVLDDGMLPAGEYDATLNIKGGGASDYRLELTWNITKPEEPVLGTLELSDVQVIEQEECGGRIICDGIMQVRAKLKNQRSVTTSQIVLLMAFKSDASDSKLYFQQELPVENVQLMPNEERILDLEIGAAENAELLKMKPVLQVLSYK